MKRYLPQKFHILIASGILLVISILVFQIVARHNHRIDLTREKSHTLSSETVGVLERMKWGEVIIRAFFGEEDPARRKFEVLLKEMKTHHPHFRYEFYDPDRSPSLTRRYKIDSYQTVIVEYHRRQERVQGYTEDLITNALVRLAHPKRQVLCFTTGHGEGSLANTERVGFSGWKDILQEHNYELREVELAKEGAPKDCDCLVVAGPHYELLAKDLDLLQNFPEKGKGLLLLIDPMDSGEGKSFGELLRSFGLLLGQNVVVDKVSQIFGGDFLVPLVSQYTDHPITQDFRVATFLPIARTVTKLSDVSEDIDVTELAKTLPGSWAETDLKKLEDGEAEFDPEEDEKGPLSLVATAEIKDAPRGARVVVVGDSDFVTNAYLALSGNKDFALNILEWLLRDDRWISIRPKEPRFEPLFLRANQPVEIASLAIGGIPFGILMIGSVGIWIRRKKSS